MLVGELPLSVISPSSLSWFVLVLFNDTGIILACPQITGLALIVLGLVCPGFNLACPKDTELVLICPEITVWFVLRTQDCPVCPEASPGLS